MSKNFWNVLLLCVEIAILLLITPTVFLKVYWLMSPKLEEMIYQHLHYQASNWLIGVIFVVSVALVFFIFRLRLIKNVHLKVFVVWIVLMLAALTMWYLRLPFVRWA